MIQINSLKGVLYPRCTSIEINIDKNNQSIQVISVDSQQMRKVCFTEEN